jgi:hypothetical protein
MLKFLHQQCLLEAVGMKSLELSPRMDSSWRARSYTERLRCVRIDLAGQRETRGKSRAEAQGPKFRQLGTLE